ALADFEAALELSPRLEIALQGKAQVALGLGKTAEAIQACNALLEENPGSTIAMTLLSACLANQGETASALAHLEAALAVEPGRADL
ncbi:tetratricopeptide repeat protein, partial [Acinetobacter baumannii]